jgi:PadR family transcriptional regulator PadR
MQPKLFSPELKKGSIELLILSLLEARPRHGYEIGKLIEARSDGELQFRISSLYPTLCRMEKRGWVKSRWVEKEGQRRRCYYRLTPRGGEALAVQRESWSKFVTAIHRVIGSSHA